MDAHAANQRSIELADRLTDARDSVTSLLEQIEGQDWLRVPGTGVWSPSKEAEHVADGNVLQQWVVRLTIGQAKASGRPGIERKQLTTSRSPAEVVEQVRRTLDEAATLIRGLTDEQLDLTTKPPKAGAPSLAQTIQHLMIDHVEHHRREIETKVGRPSRVPHLLAPDPRVRVSFGTAMDEFRGEGRGGADDDSVIGHYLRDRQRAWSSDEAFGAFTEEVRAQRLEETPRPAGYVPATELWWMDGDEFLGRLGIRYRLTPTLLEIGGHIGYDVRPSARRRGHASAMLRQGLIVARGLGIERALVTCDVGNDASRAVIERNGGVLEDERSGKLRFWMPET
jgi:predicted acetyltransferase/uncharacterized damage-inducible protein DinB